MYQLLHYKNDIYYIEPSRIKYSNLPKTIIHNNLKLIRLLDFIYIPTETENLTKEQIFGINNIRYKYKNDENIYQLNRLIKDFFSKTINIFNPDKLLDYGCGFDPIINYFTFKKDFFALDMDTSVTDLLSNKNEYKVINDMNSLTISSIDMIISIFVFHFNISKKDIKQMYQVLSRNGVIIANVYNRNEASKEKLKKMFSEELFSIYELHLPMKPTHKIWIIYKESLDNTIINKINGELNCTFINN